ncbi:Nod factor export ATP-binding protein I [Sphaerisporangium siamense]|uniref:Lipooligosaccharide transport system ATP-binding protein n=1 Tax=Sphaerisporangium siamense TaxID=795645 RepID=A0A7W7G927_9ACTN|nr:ABC transporter ATP-binding protein [Sphaerisporangium siamense]MBB4700867.1 lipooligosaccharide transport system ATP-binding protein [Sphaerisporangium siamense]GII85988.1 Nod factor export ATP-binding protein I [Sphaerisporangium siamense]
MATLHAPSHDGLVPGPDAAAISLRGVVKRYGSITAVDGLDLQVPHGICLGLLGPNGAGKSTTMRLLTAQSRADAGTITVLGHALPRESKKARALMGVVPQQDNLDEELTVRQNLEVFAHLYRVPKAGRAAAVDRALEIAQLTGRAGAKTGDLSGGMRRRLLIARGLVHRPRLVLLDEPTVGLDPQVRQELWSLVAALRADGVTTLMSTHYIEEAERLADECALMSHGRVVARGAPAALIAEHAGDRVHEHYGPPERLAEVEALAKAAGFATRRTGPSVSILAAERLPDPLRRDLGPATIERAATLEDVFVLLTGENVE